MQLEGLTVDSLGGSQGQEVGGYPSHGEYSTLFRALSVSFTQTEGVFLDSLFHCLSIVIVLTLHCLAAIYG